MADMLATPDELALFMQRTDLDEDAATLYLELATAEVQVAAGNQRLVEVVDDEVLLMGYWSNWLELPQRPVSAIDSVVIDEGDPLVEGTDFKRYGAKLRRRAPVRGCYLPWSPYVHEPVDVVVVYTHGLPVGDQELEFARSATFAIARSAAANPTGIMSESIDDYRVQFAAADVLAAMERAPYLRKALERKYGCRASLTPIG